MLDHFHAFASLANEGFQAVVEENAFVTAVDSDVLYAEYLAAFPEGTNPIFKKRTEHDCSCCRQFIRRAGSVVSVRGDAVVTVWDAAAEKVPYPYNVVASRLRDVVRSANISDLYRVGAKEASFGSRQTRSLDPAGAVATWNHLYSGEIPKTLRVASPDQVRGEYRTTTQVFERGLTELTVEAVETTLSLVDANALYRGEEHRRAIVEFQKAQRSYLDKNVDSRRLFVWTNAQGPAARFRNTAIGTLVQDLSAGMEVEAAVRSFEVKVAPQNYKRTSAVITPGMVKKAMETIAELGLEPALERRFATLADISVNDVKWVDGAVKPLMKGGIGDALMQHAASQRSVESDEGHAEEISLDDFVGSVLPDLTSVEIFFKGAQLGNLVSLTAPIHPEPKQLFRWSNDFAWSYRGNVADSIAERVKKAGGRVDGAVLRVSLSWFNYDDLDLHVLQPPGQGIREAINFRCKRGWTGGVLDVDMNAGGGTTREPVENIVWTDRWMPDGAYKVEVNNFAHREAGDPGFVVEVENAGKISHFSYNKTVRNKQTVHVVTLYVSGGVVTWVEMGDAAITASNISKEVWGLKTEQYAKVSVVCLSPNYWGADAVGNRHTFFMLEGAANDEPTRGIYNEFLHPRLEPHRKVFEIIGDKTKCQPVSGQLSGLGFSSTKRDSFLVKAYQGKKRRVFNVKVGV